MDQVEFSYIAVNCYNHCRKLSVSLKDEGNLTYDLAIQFTAIHSRERKPDVHTETCT